MPPIAGLRDMDDRAWSTATWTAPIIAPLVLGTMFILLWLLGKLPVFPVHECAWFIAGAVVTPLISTPVSIAMLTSSSSRIRGLALSIIGSSVVVVIGGVIAGFLVFR